MNETVNRLMDVLARLPGIGRRSAERIALRLVRSRALGRDLIGALQDLEEKVRLCSLCGAVTPQGEDPCRLCTDPRRDARRLCVVEEPADIAQIEKSAAFRGRYHALMGRLSPMRGEGPSNPRFEALLSRLKPEQIEEVILALNTDVESDATAAYLRDHLAARGVRVSRIAFGLPAGSGIAYSDPITLQRAMEWRRDI